MRRAPCHSALIEDDAVQICGKLTASLVSCQCSIHLEKGVLGDVWGQGGAAKHPGGNGLHAMLIASNQRVEREIDASARKQHQIVIGSIDEGYRGIGHSHCRPHEGESTACAFAHLTYSMRLGREKFALDAGGGCGGVGKIDPWGTHASRHGQHPHDPPRR